MKVNLTGSFTLSRVDVVGKISSMSLGLSFCSLHSVIKAIS